MSAGWAVLKFGGTSVASLERWETIAQVVRARLDEGIKPLVVCSAVSGITSQLEALLREAPLGQFEPVLEAIVARHQVLADALGVDMTALIGEELETLRRLALGASLIREVSPRLHARVLARGELMSTRLGVAFLKARGLPVDWIDARDCLNAADVEGMDLQMRYTSAVCGLDADPALRTRLDELGGAVVTQGFIARNGRGETVLLGRGGSDTSAALLAARIGAERCEIWTDVPGMYTANPRQIPGARLLRSLGYDEAQEIASTGAKVLHPRSIPPVRHHNIPLHIRCTNRPDLRGTVIEARAARTGPQVKAISARKGQTLVSMDTPGMWQQVGFLADVFACFKRHGFSVDLVSTSEMNVTVSLDPASNTLTKDRLDALVADLDTHCAASVIGPCAAVSLVGRDIRAILHKLGPALAVFEEQRVHLVSQAASDLNLTFVVDEAQAERMVKRLHVLLFESIRHSGETFGATWEALFGQGETFEESDGARAPWWRSRREDLLAVAMGNTPAYVYDAASLDGAAARLASMRSIDRVFYAMKANPCDEVLERFYKQGIGFECVSPGELDKVFGLFEGLDPSRVLFTPNFAPREEYEAGFERGVWVTLDNLHPLERWPEVFRGRDILVRIDPGQGRGHHDYVKTAGARSKFGVSQEQLGALEALVAKAGARVVGLHAHSGSGILDPEGWSEVAATLAEVAERFPDVRHLDLGGGLGVPEKAGRAPLDLAALDASLSTFKAAHPRFELWLEPGRYLVAEAGVLLARVAQLKQKGPVRYVGIDAGMHTLIRPALYGAFHDIWNLSRLSAPPEIVANIVGPICETGDTLGYNRHLPQTDEGDILLIDTAGAYGRAMSSRYNLRGPATEILLENQDPNHT